MAAAQDSAIREDGQLDLGLDHFSSRYPIVVSRVPIEVPEVNVRKIAAYAAAAAVKVHVAGVGRGRDKARHQWPARRTGVCKDLSRQPRGRVADRLTDHQRAPVV